jgi:hypothetical protein
VSTATTAPQGEFFGTGVSAAQNAVPAINSQAAWAVALLTLIGAPVTQNNITNLVAWQNAEGGAGPQFGIPGNITNFNPINVSLTTGPNGYGYDPGTGAYYPGASPTPGNNPPIASFSDWATGLKATADRLQEPFASPILAALKGNASQATLSQAIGSTGWGTGYAVATASTTPKQVVSGQPTAVDTSVLGSLGQDVANGLFGFGGGLLGLGGTAAKVVGAVAGSGQVLDELGKILTDFTSPTWWKRVGLFVFGGILAVTGLVVLLSTTNAGQKAEGEIASAAPLAAAAA